MSWLDAEPTTIESKLEAVEAPQLFTAEQVATAITAAIEAHASGADPTEAAQAALAP